MELDWVAILTSVLKAILENCPEPDPAKVAANIRKPRLVQKLRFENDVRRQSGVTLREWREIGRDVMAEIYAERDKMTDAELIELVKESKAA